MINYLVALPPAWGYLIGGHTDWRLPNEKELQSLIDFSQYNPALPSGHPFVNVESYAYWSSTTLASDPGEAWYVRIAYGVMSSDNKYVDYLYSVWPVRAGQ